MRHVLILALPLILVPALASASGGINLAWSDCGQAGTSYAAFSCDTNAGTSTLIISAMPERDMPEFNGTQVVVDMQIDADEVSPWWTYAADGCRYGALTVSFDFTAGPATCADPWNGSAIGGLNYQAPYNGDLQRMRLRGVGVYSSSATHSLSPGVEYYLMAFRFDHRQTVGDGACAGCFDKVCMVLNSVWLTQPLAVNDDEILTNPLFSVVATWRCPGGPAADAPGCFYYCGTPAHRSTWGEMKSLYR